MRKFDCCIARLGFCDIIRSLLGTLLLLPCLMCLANINAKADTKVTESVFMKIELAKQSFYLGESIVVTVSVENNTKEALSIADPAASFDVEMHAVDKANQEDLSYTMGIVEATILEGGQDEWALSVPVPDTITIAAASAYVFETDLNERLYLRDGVFDVFVSDIESGTALEEITIKFRMAALPYLSKIAMDQQQSYSRREWAMEWIQKLYPEFILKLRSENTPAALVQKDEEYNQIQYNALVKWCEEKR